MAAASNASAPSESTKTGPSFKNGKKLGTPDIQGWWIAKPGAEVEGKAIGRLQIMGEDDKPRDIVIVQTTRKCICSSAGDKKEVEMPEGSIVGVGISFKNTELLNYVAKQGLVYCRAIEKKKLDGKKTMWLYECVGEAGKDAPPPPVHTPPVANSESSAPF